MKKFILTLSNLLFFLLLSTHVVFSQGVTKDGNQNNIPKDGKVSGTIIDGSTKETIPFASVAIYHAKDSTLVTGVLSGTDGSFTIENLPYGKFYIQITFVGYKKHRVNDILITPNQKTIALGSVKVNTSTVALQGVDVVGNQPPVTYQIDKKVINIGQNLTTTGGTLADALQNAPSVQTDVQGNITVRGSSNFTVLVDGRPSPIAGSEALQQIPANLVQDVEIITNPSAKYDAEGSAGIVNVIMKKQKVKGESAMVNLTAGTGHKYSGNVNLNYKISKFNFTLGGDFSDNQFKIKNNMNNTDTLKNQIMKYQSVTGNGHFSRKGYAINAGIDYTIDDKNSLTLTGSFGNRTFSRPSTSTYHDQYVNTVNSGSSDIYYLNTTIPEFTRDYKTLNLDYLLKLDSKGQQLSASVYYTGGPNNNVSTLKVDTTDVNWNLLEKAKINQQSDQNSNETDRRLKADYELPLGKKGKFDAGYQVRYFNSNASYKLTNDGIEDSTQRDNLIFKDQIQAGYVTLSNSMPLFDYQIGMRVEYENRLLNQEIQNQVNKINRTDWFPSVHLTRQLPWNLQLMASYTKRINRPQQWNLNPFILHLDPQSIRVGNPLLLPEFANSYELNLEKKLNKASYISAEGFLRQTSDLIQQISTFDPLTQITTNTITNIDHDRSMGVEFMLYIEPVKWFNLNTSVNLFNYRMFGTPIPTVASKINTWNVHISPTFHINKETSVQANYTYNAPSITAQGTRSGYYSSTLAIKRSLFKDKGSLTLQIRDLIGQTETITTTQSSHQFKSSDFQRESQVFLLTFSYRINNYKAKQTGKRNENDSNLNEQDIEGQGF